MNEKTKPQKIYIDLKSKKKMLSNIGFNEEHVYVAHSKPAPGLVEYEISINGEDDEKEAQG